MNKTADGPSPILKRLDIQYVNDTLVFSTIFSVGTTQANSVTSILQFDISGKIIKIIDYSINTYDDAKILDFASYSNNSFIVLSTLGSNEKIDSESYHLLIFMTSGRSFNFTNLEKKVSRIGFNPHQNIILTSDRGGKSVDKRSLNGDLIETILLDIEIAEISFMYEDYILIQNYRDPEFNSSDLPVILLLTIFIIIPLIIYFLSKIYLKYKKNN